MGNEKMKFRKWLSGYVRITKDVLITSIPIPT